MTSLSTLTELKGRLDWTLDADEERVAQAALDDASALACGYGRAWEPAATPRLVRMLVLKVVVRYLRNPDGYTQSRAGDESVAWNDAAGENAGSVYFTDDEIKLLRSLAGKTPTVTSVPISAWGPQRKAPVGLVPALGGSPFPLFASDENPW